jgi:hypothetical protein
MYQVDVIKHSSLQNSPHLQQYDSSDFSIFIGIPYAILKEFGIFVVAFFIVFPLLIQTDVILNNFQFWVQKNEC